MFRPARMERELDRAVDSWLAWLGRWDPTSGRGSGSACDSCPRWERELAVGDLPHGVLHALTTALGAIVADTFERAIASRHPELSGRGAVQVVVDADRVRVALPGARAAQPSVETELVGLYERIRFEAVLTVRARRDAMRAAVESHVEPKVQWLADQLLLEIGAA